MTWHGLKQEADWLREGHGDPEDALRRAVAHGARIARAYVSAGILEDDSPLAKVLEAEFAVLANAIEKGEVDI